MSANSLVIQTKNSNILTRLVLVLRGLVWLVRFYWTSRKGLEKYKRPLLVSVKQGLKSMYIQFITLRGATYPTKINWRFIISPLDVTHWPCNTSQGTCKVSQFWVRTHFISNINNSQANNKKKVLLWILSFVNRRLCFTAISARTLAINHIMQTKFMKHSWPMDTRQVNMLMLFMLAILLQP